MAIPAVVLLGSIAGFTHLVASLMERLAGPVNYYRISAGNHPSGVPDAARSTRIDDHWLIQIVMLTSALFLLGVSELVIGLTVVAVGTSLPEIATSVLARLRGERDIAVGNVIGSGLFNIAVSGYGQEEDRRRAREAGFDWHLVKPVDSEQLAELVNQLPGSEPR